MITDNQILTLIARKINVEDVTSVIDGLICKGERPHIERDFQDIVIGILTNDPGNNSRLQSGTININCFCKEVESLNIRDEEKLDEITNAVINALDVDNGLGIFEDIAYEVVSIKTFRDYENKKMFFTNIKLNFTYKT